MYDAQGQMINRKLFEEEQSTAIGDAVTLAVARLQPIRAKSKIIILLSDGENTAGVVSPRQGAEAAATMGIKIYAIGIGSTGLAPFQRPGRPRDVITQQVVLDEATLRMMAQTTGGTYFNAKDTQALEEVYAEIDKLETTTIAGRVYTDYQESSLVPGSRPGLTRAVPARQRHPFSQLAMSLWSAVTCHRLFPFPPTTVALPPFAASLESCGDAKATTSRRTPKRKSDDKSPFGVR